jgi:hypothetical protein
MFSCHLLMIGKHGRNYQNANTSQNKDDKNELHQH